MWYLTDNFSSGYDKSILKYDHDLGKIYRIATHDKLNTNNMTRQIGEYYSLVNFVDNYKNNWRQLHEISI
jgi:hypothetical protein